ncbi:MAG: hypothetical protein H7X95_07025 [Deltaproteobacteria bacterium]|nr:hypothetical protein [Deltaproteobacteria bacterium]
MQAQKLQVKIFASTGDGHAPEAFIPIFHSWIKHHVLPELMIDVANYAHVPQGPGVVLIGHACDTFMDESEGRLGLLHNRKRGAPAPEERLSDAFRRALHAAILLQADPALAGKLHFSPNEFLFRINDRLTAPNTDKTFAALKPELTEFAAKLFDGPAEVKRVGDVKSLFGVRIVAPASTTPATLETLLARLGGAPTN